MVQAKEFWRSSKLGQLLFADFAEYPIVAEDPCPYLELDLSSKSPRALKQRSALSILPSAEQGEAES